MSLSNDIIKIKLVEDGFFPNYPYHLISDKELWNFLYFNHEYIQENYPRPEIDSDSELVSAYDTLMYSILYHINTQRLDVFNIDQFDLSKIPCYGPGQPIQINDTIYIRPNNETGWSNLDNWASYSELPKLPDWVYSYLLGSTIGPNSDYRDIHDLLIQLGIDNVSDIFTSEASKQCLKISKQWVQKHDSNQIMRPPTIFGELHVIKSLRLLA